jgi:DNA-binding transcriptional regulator LsrR (DeoR family)
MADISKDLLDEDIELMTRVATFYHLEDLTQDQIAKRLNLSRAKVGRILRKAKSKGIVEISVRPHPVLNFQLEAALVDRFGLKQALIAVNQSDPAAQRSTVAQLVAGYLSRNLRDGMLVAVGMGSNTGAIAEYVFHPLAHDCTFISAMGGSPVAGVPMNPDNICSRFAIRFGGKSESLYAPGYVDNLALREMLLNHETIRQTLNRARRSDMAVIGVGDLSKESNAVKLGWFPAQEVYHPEGPEAVGDMLGNFFDINGNEVTEGRKGATVGLSMDELRQLPEVIMVASEPRKVLAILGALRTGVVNILATTAGNAQSILTLDKETGGPGA